MRFLGIMILCSINTYVGKFLVLFVACTILVLQCHVLALLFLDGERMHRTDVFLQAACCRLI